MRFLRNHTEIQKAKVRTHDFGFTFFTFMIFIPREQCSSSMKLVLMPLTMGLENYLQSMQLELEIL